MWVREGMYKEMQNEMLGGSERGFSDAYCRRLEQERGGSGHGGVGG